MNILTDILSLIRRGKFAKTASKDDVLVLGMWNEEPEMTGVASPIPYKSVKLIKVKDFKVAAEHCAHANSPATPATGTGQIYQKTVADETTEECTVYYRSIKSLSSNLTIGTSTDDNYVELTTLGEPNLAANVGVGLGVYKNKVGETLNFKSLIGGSNIQLTQSTDEITINASVSHPDQSDTIAFGQLYALHTGDTPGTAAMTYPKFKTCAKTVGAGNISYYSVTDSDWTDNDQFVDATNVIEKDPGFGSTIKLNKDLAIGDQIKLDVQVVIKNINNKRAFAMLGTYACSDTENVNKWTLSNVTKDELSGITSDGYTIFCQQISTTLTSALTATLNNVVVGFSFGNLEADDVVKVSWSVATVKSL